MTTRTVVVKLRSEVAAAIAANRRAQDSYKGVREEVERLDGAGRALTKIGLVSALSAVPGVAAPATLAMGALSSMVLTAGASFGAVALATSGMGDAFEAVGEGNAEKLREAMGKLSNEGQRFVQEYERVKPLLDQIGDASQDAVFGQFNGSLERLVTSYLPTMLDQMPRLGREIGSAGAQLARWAGSPDVVAKINRQIVAATEVTEDWTRLLKAGGGVLLELADSSIDANKSMVSGLADGTEALERWLATAKAQGELNQIYANGERVFQRLGDIAAKTAAILAEFARNPAYTDALMTFLDLIHVSLSVLQGFLAAFAALPQPLQSAATMLVAIGAAAALLAGRVAVLKGVLAAASVSLTKVGPAGAAAAGGLRTAEKYAGRAAAAFIGLQIAGMALRELGPASADVDELAKSLEHLADTGRSGGELDRLFGERSGLLTGLMGDSDFEGLVRDLQQVSSGMSGIGRSAEAMIPVLGPLQELIGGSSWTGSAQNVEALDQALTSMIKNGQVAEAQASYTRLLQQSGKSHEDLLKQLPGYKNAMAGVEKSTNLAAVAHTRVTREATLLSGTLSEAVRSGKSLMEIFNELNGASLNWAQAENNLEEAIDKAGAGIVRQKDALSATNETGRQNREMLLEIARATNVAGQARLDETQSLFEANKVYEQGRQALINAAIAAGATRTQAELLAGQWIAMPSLVQTKVTAPGLEATIARVNYLIERAQKLGGYAANPRAFHDLDYTPSRRWGGITEHARWGLLKDAQVYTSVASGARYAFAEPATGGEAFVPRFGDADRSLSILDQAAGWYGHTLAPAGGRAGGGGGVQTVVHHHVHTHELTVSGREQVTGWRRRIQLSGGDVQGYLGSGG